VPEVQRAQRKYVDTPGDNTCRGLNNVPLASNQSAFEAKVTHATKTEILLGTGGMEVKAEETQDVELIVDEAPPPTPSAGEWSVEPSFAVDLFPWEFSELVVREFQNMYRPAVTVALAAGSGYWALAAAREGIRHTSVVRNKAHREVVDQRLTAMILFEMLTGKDDGFRVARFLSRASSLGGSSVGVPSAHTAEGPESGKAAGASSHGPEAGSANPAGASSQDAAAGAAGAAAPNTSAGATCAKAPSAGPGPAGANMAGEGAAVVGAPRAEGDDDLDLF
jgi:hypothetical protein